MKLKDLAELTGGRILGNPDVEVTGAAGIEDAKEGDITFLADRKHLLSVSSSKASVIIAADEIKTAPATLLITANPYLTFAKALEILYARPAVSPGISDKAITGSDVSFGNDVTIYPQVYIGSRAVIGSRVTLYPGVYIGENSSIGDDSMIYPNVTIRENVRIGKKVIIHSGTVLGSDGFGYIQNKGTHYKIPQVGGVIIEDNVEIGANVTIDRATTGNTVIGAGTKIDNLAQIAHNVRIGKNCIIVAQVGIGGSTEIGDGVVLAGQVGVKDHVKIGNGAIAAAQSGVVTDIPDGQVYSGMPAIPHRAWLRAQSIFSKLPEYIKRLQEVERKIEKDK
ncbi:MAG: UDP-3-O-(3-hydroxymyristoyl)glucosamine N-acyltransferase [Nitrospiraceae bacterium]|nr:MAG: UDP-3-O-(3-hydroxymyristoyl)glucosamine N-acyltransferase [Nitrospiraceae bacterium]